MKLLKMNYCDYYAFPEGINGSDEFVKFINSNYNRFITLTKFDTDNCVPPYFVTDDIKKVYINIAEVSEIEEVEMDAVFLSRDEYDERLKEIVERVCVNCVSYEEDNSIDNLLGHRSQISLDGNCRGFCKRHD